MICDTQVAMRTTPDLVPQAAQDACLGEASYRTWSRVAYCANDCEGHPMCAACVAVARQMDACRRVETL